MTSEIRVNKLTNRIGLSTVTFADSGIGVTVTGRIDPDTDSARDLGTTSVRWRNAYVDTYYGDGSNLTGITGTTINNNATTKFITGTNNANELDCEANLSYNNSLVTFASSSLMVSKGTSPTISVKETAGNKEGAFRANTDGVLIRSLGNYPLIFHTNQTERAQIDGSGRFLIGTNSVYNANSYSNNLIIYENGDAGASIIGNASTSNYASLYLTDTTTAIKGYLEAQLGVNGNFTIGANGSGPIRFTNNGAERLRIDGSGRVLIGTTTEGHTSADDLTLATSGNTGMTIRSGTSNDGSIFFSDGTSGGDEYRGYVQYNHPNDKLAFGTSGATRLTIDGDGRLLVGNNSDSRTTTLILSGNSSTGVTGQGILNIDIGTTSVSDGTSIGVIRFGAIGDRRGADVRAEGAGTWSAGSSHPTDLIFGTNASGSSSTPTERMRLRSDGHLQLQHGLTALSGGGVIVCAAKSSSGTANQSNYKVDFVVPMGDLGTKQEYADIQAQFSSGQTGKDYSHARGGSGILIATVQNDYYWGFRTKIYHITTYGNNSNNVTQLNLLHNYSAAGHGANSASVDLTVQSHDGKTPTLRGTFSGDYWNSNILTVTYIGSAVASTGNIRQLTAFDSKLTGQDPTWK